MSRDEGPVAVIGMGYVGIALSAILADRGYEVLGVDVDPERVSQIEDATCPVEEPEIDGRFERHAEQSTIEATTDYDRVSAASTVVVTVGTPLADSEPDLGSVVSATKQLAAHVRSGQTVVYRSTLPATTTEETIRPILEERSGLEAGDDFALAFSPERMAEGSAYEDLTSTPVVVGGVTEECRERVVQFWESTGMETVAVPDPTAAELVKLADNWWIDLNIALANEVALLSERVGVDALEVIEAANTLPKGQHHVNILYPGAGVGGSCLPKDPRFVAELGAELGLDLETPRVSRRVNERMPDHVADLLRGAVPDVSGLRVAVLGYAFKAGTDDTRNTPARPLIETLLADGAEVRVVDPLVPASVVTDEVGVEPLRLPEALDGADAVVVVTGHDQFRSLTPETLVEHVGDDEFVVVDGRHVFDPAAFETGNVEYLGVGRGCHG